MKTEMTLEEFFAEAKRIGLTADIFAKQLAARPEFADCLNAPQVAQGDERAAFEAIYGPRPEDAGMEQSCWNDAWETWQESAAVSRQSAAPAEWKLVPVEPTEKMLANGQWKQNPGNSVSECLKANSLAREIYRSMLLAAPSYAPIADSGVAKDAARYRMARTMPLVLMADRITPRRPDKFDAMIDAALIAQGKAND